MESETLISEDRKRNNPFSEVDENVLKILRYYEEEETEETEELEIEEEIVKAVMKSLEEEIKCSSRSHSRSLFGMNEESCGSSVSDMAATVMAGVMMAGVMRCLPAKSTEADSSEAEAPTADEEEQEDEWIARILDGPAFDFEECYL